MENQELSGNNWKWKVQAVLDDNLTEDLRFMKVYVGTILDKKFTSKLILELVKKIPIQNHLKRVRNNEIILFPIEFCSAADVFKNLKDKGIFVEFLSKDIKIVQVPSKAPMVRNQYINAQKHWPCNFHPDNYLEKLVTNQLFTLKELNAHGEYINICKIVEEITNSMSVVIVDPKINSIVAIGTNESTASPVKHPCMTAIDNVAKTQGGGAWPDRSNNRLVDNLNVSGIPLNLYNDLLNRVKCKFGASKFQPKSEDGPYLCTGYYAYSTHEPCVMCAMALIHSRVKCVFYERTNERGALGTLCKLHTVKELNHHYTAFVVINNKIK